LVDAQRLVVDRAGKDDAVGVSRLPERDPPLEHVAPYELGIPIER
jgi:hypothetical protein